MNLQPNWCQVAGATYITLRMGMNSQKMATVILMFPLTSALFRSLTAMCYYFLFLS